ncbi:MAG: phosphatase PAP2 family protein, partial [candidate division Zixibacteria bacterium]
VNYVIENGAVHGGCMPSTHVAVAIVIMMVCFRYYRRAGWYLLPVNIGLAVGTVWGRFHYVSDVFVGTAIAICSVWIVERYLPQTASSSDDSPLKDNVEVTYAS